MILDFQNNFICGRKFQVIADFIRDTDKRLNYSELRNGSIIWCKIDFVRDLFENIRNSKDRYILITHNGDWPVTRSLFELKPMCIKKWFAENADCLHEDLVPLPLGLENDMGPSKGAYTDYESIAGNMNTLKKDINKVYCNFNVNNYHSRTETKRILIQKGVGFIDERQNYNTYCSNMSRYQFVASPRGNGIDCHRTWEALYLGCIPIVERHFMYDTYDLPIIQIDAWEDVDNDWMNDQYAQFCNRKNNYRQLEMNYWLDKIKKERDGL